jgi:DNA polymerase-3 subunit alpha
MGLFAMLDDDDKAAAIPIPKLKELNKADLMLMEKETTGIYLSGHPMDDFRHLLRGTHVVPIGKLMSEDSPYEDDAIVSVAGVVQAIKMKTTKNNSMMAYVSLEDDTASIEMLAFSNVLNQYGGYLKENNPVVITGRLSIRDEKEPQIVINRARPISDFANESAPEPVQQPVRQPVTASTLYLQLAGESDPRYRKVKAILSMFPGSGKVVLFFADNRTRRGTQADFDSRMLEELKNLLGETNVVLK